MHGKYTVAETLSQSEMNAWNPVPSTEPAVLQQLHSSKFTTRKSETEQWSRSTTTHRQAYTDKQVDSHWMFSQQLTLHSVSSNITVTHYTRLSGSI